MKAIAFLAVALATLPAAAVQQSELGGKVRSGQEVTVPSGETVQGDLIASAGRVRIDGRVDGDLVASGGEVTVAGTVTGDVMVGAGSTTISGQVGGDVRAGTGQARIEGQVGEDLDAGGQHHFLRERTTSEMSRMCSGLEPQHAPTMLHPASRSAG